MARILPPLTAIMVALMSVSPSLGETVVNVPGTADPYAAGLPSGTNCCAGDTTPANSPVLAPLTFVSGEYLTFSTTGGTSHSIQPVSPTADGDTSFFYNLTHSFGTGISGPTNIHLNGLAGVFLGASNPSGAAPVSSDGTSFTSISPLLNQIFFIGDGLTGTGAGDVQTFYVPDGATRLYLGIMDDGGYFDNHGTIIATINAVVPSASSDVPEPAPWAMMIGGFGLIGGAMRRRKVSVSFA